jgi:hypothetical protein
MTTHNSQLTTCKLLIKKFYSYDSEAGIYPDHKVEAGERLAEINRITYEYRLAVLRLRYPEDVIKKDDRLFEDLSALLNKLDRQQARKNYHASTGRANLSSLVVGQHESDGALSYYINTGTLDSVFERIARSELDFVGKIDLGYQRAQADHDSLV